MLLVFYGDDLFLLWKPRISTKEKKVVDGLKEHDSDNENKIESEASPNWRMGQF